MEREQHSFAPEHHPILVLAGPTGVGKTDLSIALAERLDAEIVSADSRQVFRGLSVGTAKPGPDQLARIRHHFIDELDLDEPFSAGRFADAANERIGEMLSRGKTPIVVGGSTLYLHALQYGLADVPAVPEGVRDQVEVRLNTEGPDALYAELARIDPVSAATMDPSKSQRLVRALEVYYGTGAPLSSFFDTAPPPRYSFRTIVLTRAREHLYERINNRVDEMLRAGLVEEVREVTGRYGMELNALQTIGYQEPISYLRGEIDRDEMTRLIKRNTRRYAKRQLTWFRRFPEYEWVDLDSAGTDEVADRLATH